MRLSRKLWVVVTFASLMPSGAPAQVVRLGERGLRGDAEAIADARAMVEVMGGATIWAQLGSMTFVHKWYPSQRVDTYVEHEILDLTAPRSWVERRSEINVMVRAYSPAGGQWTLTNGVFARSEQDELAASLRRAPFNFFRLARGVAADDGFYEVRFGPGDIPGTRRLEFRGPDGYLGGWVILNARKEPIVKATPDYRYTLGPLKLFGNLRVPAWGVYDNGYTRFEMIDLTGDRGPPADTLFAAREGIRP